MQGGAANFRKRFLVDHLDVVDRMKTTHDENGVAAGQT